MLARALHLDEPPFAAHHDIHVDVGAHVFVVVEIETRLAIDDADAHARRRDASPAIAASFPFDTIQSNASTTATHAPVIAAVRVPPSARSTSQSSLIVNSPNAKVVEHRANAAADQPLNLLRATADLARARATCASCVARGSIAYSAVSHPSPRPRRQPGTPSSTDAVQSTRVAPNETRHEPSA